MECIEWIALKSVPLVGNVVFRRLLEHFDSPAAVLRASAAELSRLPGIGPAVADSIAKHDFRHEAELECRKVTQAGVRIVTCLDENYPQSLREIHDYPPYLYLQGDITTLEPALAVVGSRRASSYGLVTTERLAGELAAAGITIVSGMARGIDTAAHRAALKAGGKSVGVLGSGIDVVYPPENRRLFAEMAAQGGLISEFPLGTLPLPENFPRRNRLISGLCRGVLVVEAAEQSGSLITAQCALEQGREVFAVPGNISFSSSRGTNRLIKQGAKLVEEVADILEELPSFARPAMKRRSPPQLFLDEQEEMLCSLLATGALQIDEIITKSALTVGDVSAILLRLELKGIVTQLPGKYFSLA